MNSEALSNGTAPIRFLREGEKVDVSEIAPGLKLVGTAVSVREEDGEITAVLTKTQTNFLREVAFLHLSVKDGILSSTEARYLRRFLKLTQSELATEIKFCRETVIRSEKERPSFEYSRALQHLAMARVQDVTAAWTAEQKTLNQKKLAEVQDKIAHKIELDEGFQVGSDFRLIMESC